MLYYTPTSFTRDTNSDVPSERSAWAVSESHTGGEYDTPPAAATATTLQQQQVQQRQVKGVRDDNPHEERDAATNFGQPAVTGAGPGPDDEGLDDEDPAGPEDEGRPERPD